MYRYYVMVCIIKTYAKHPINGTVKHMLMMKKALGIDSSVLLYTTLYNGKIALFDKLSMAILTAFIDPIINTITHVHNSK